MQAPFYIIVRNGFSMNFSIRGSSAWWLLARIVRVTALDIQVSLRNPTALLEDSMTSVKTLFAVCCLKYFLQTTNEESLKKDIDISFR